MKNFSALLVSITRCNLHQIKELLSTDSELFNTVLKNNKNEILAKVINTYCSELVQYFCTLTGFLFNEIDESGKNALHLAALNGNSRSLVELIQLGIDVNHQSDDLATPLHNAVTSERVRCAEVLLDAGANPNFQDEIGSTSLHYAAKVGNDLLIKLLLSRGSDRSISDSKGNSAADLAKKWNRTSAIELLNSNGVSAFKIPFENDVLDRMIDESEVDYYGREWRSNQSSDSLSWLYDYWIETVTDKTALLTVLGRPTHDYQDSLIFQSSDGRVSVSFQLEKSGKLMAWKRL